MPYKNKIDAKLNQKIYYNKHKKYLSKKSKIYRKNFRKLNPWYGSYVSAKERCNNPNNKDYKNYGGRGIKFLLTKEDYKNIWNRDKGWLLKQPSIDRINNDGNYEFNNCQFIEKKINSLKRRMFTKPILQYDLQGNFIKEWKSIKEASSELKINSSSIGNCINKRKYYLTAGGFIWKYKKKEDEL